MRYPPPAILQVIWYSLVINGRFRKPARPPRLHIFPLVTLATMYIYTKTIGDYKWHCFHRNNDDICKRCTLMSSNVNSVFHILSPGWDRFGLLKYSYIPCYFWQAIYLFKRNVCVVLHTSWIYVLVVWRHLALPLCWCVRTLNLAFNIHVCTLSILF